MELDKRREAIVKSLEERGLFTDELKEKIGGAESLTVLEDIYLPFRPKRRTRATVAKEKGLEPLAERIFEQGEMDIEAEAAAFIDAEKGVASVEEALTGARDIIAEWVSENQLARERMHELFAAKGIMRSKVIYGKEEEGIKYKTIMNGKSLSRRLLHTGSWPFAGERTRGSLSSAYCHPKTRHSACSNRFS